MKPYKWKNSMNFCKMFLDYENNVVHNEYVQLWRKQGSFDWQGKDRRSICSKLQINWQPSFIFCTVPSEDFQITTYFFPFKFKHWVENEENRTVTFFVSKYYVHIKVSILEVAALFGDCMAFSGDQ